MITNSKSASDSAVKSAWIPFEYLKSCWTTKGWIQTKSASERCHCLKIGSKSSMPQQGTCKIGYNYLWQIVKSLLKETGYWARKRHPLYLISTWIYCLGKVSIPFYLFHILPCTTYKLQCSLFGFGKSSNKRENMSRPALFSSQQQSLGNTMLHLKVPRKNSSIWKFHAERLNSNAW